MKKLTSTAGNIIGDNQNSLSAGERGPVLMQDYYLIEKLAHQNRERIPERVVHAKGTAAHGKLTITHDITKFSKADLFSYIGKETPVFLRFSTVAGEKGAADAERDVRGFAIKFYTQEGNWDLVGYFLILYILKKETPKQICVGVLVSGIFGHNTLKVYIKLLFFFQIVVYQQI